MVTPAMERMRQDRDSGGWRERRRDLLDGQALDYGYRLRIAGRKGGCVLPSMARNDRVHDYLPIGPSGVLAQPIREPLMSPPTQYIR